MLSLSQQVTLTYTNIFESKTLQKIPKHQNQAWGTKSKKQLKNSQLFLQHGFKIGFLNSLYAWTDITNLG